MDRTIIKDVMKKIERLIVDKRFDLLYEGDYAREMPADVMQQVVEEYGNNFTMPPDEAFDRMSIVDISEEEASVYCYLWYDNERSDLTAIARVKNIGGEVRYAIEDIHIL